MPKSLFVDPAETRAQGKIKFKDIPVNVYNKTIAEELKGHIEDIKSEYLCKGATEKEAESAEAAIKNDRKTENIFFIFSSSFYFNYNTMNLKFNRLSTNEQICVQKNSRTKRYGRKIILLWLLI